jgi:hypothetical protein
MNSALGLQETCKEVALSHSQRSGRHATGGPD